MGQCFSCVPCFQASSSSERDRSVTKVALKLPHGLKGMEYDAYKKRFVGCHIQEWLARLYRDATWTNWVTYNDQNHLGLSKKGHCKGIVAWNETRVSWLCHSVPHFPREFNGTTLSDIEPSEHLYGQSFHYYECDRTPDLVRSIFHQLYTMDACPILQRYTEGRTWDSERVTFKKEGAFTTLALGETMFTSLNRRPVKLMCTANSSWFTSRPNGRWRRGYEVISSRYRALWFMTLIHCATNRKPTKNLKTIRNGRYRIRSGTGLAI